MQYYPVLLCSYYPVPKEKKIRNLVKSKQNYKQCEIEKYYFNSIVYFYFIKIRLTMRVTKEGLLDKIIDTKTTKIIYKLQFAKS